ncbi:MAG: lyase family protein [Planctomycetota bacterium]
MTDEHNEFAARTDHRRQTPGAQRAPRWNYWKSVPGQKMHEIGNKLPYNARMSRAWVIMLYHQDVIERETAQKLLRALEDADEEAGHLIEPWLREKLDGDEDVASAVNLGRTTQEPMTRMQLRDFILDVFDVLHDAMEVTLDKSEETADAMMAGRTHYSQAQPTTYGAYLLAVHDPLWRGMEQLELAYRTTNMNSGGCGACSGPGWPVDRQMITELLGFDRTLEPTYDCESSYDEVTQILFALSSIAITLARTTLDHEIWTLEAMMTHEVAPQWQGVSSLMPQKAHSGGIFENIRIPCNDVLGEMNTAVTSLKAESIQDTLIIKHSPHYAMKGCATIQRALGLWTEIIPGLQIDRKRMKRIVREGYSGAPDLVIKMVRDYGYGKRQAHRICCNFVRLARERDINPSDMTGELLDEAAGITDEPRPGLSTEEVQDAMGLENFFEKHQCLGSPAPEETRRLVGKRRDRLAEARERQTERRKRLARANERLEEEVKKVIGER